MTNYQNLQWGKLVSKAALLLCYLCAPLFFSMIFFCQKTIVVLVKSKQNYRLKKMSPHCVTSKTEKFMKNTPLCTMYSLICYPSRSALLSQEYFVLLPLLSSTQLFPSNKYRTAHKQFVIGGNEFLIIETDNVLWHLEQCCFSALLRAREP